MTISKTLRGRTATAVSLTAVLALAATGCGDDGSSSGTEGSGKGEITFWDNNGGPRTAVWTEIIKDFEKKNPDIEVNYVPIPIADVQSKYDTAIAAWRTARRGWRQHRLPRQHGVAGGPGTDQ